MKRLFVLSIAFSLAVALRGVDYAFDNTSLSGTVVCNTATAVNPQKGASGPQGAAAAQQLAAAGRVSLVADGQGNWTSGSGSYQLGNAACNYALSSGTYVVNADGSGQATTSWGLVPSTSTQGCAPIIPQSTVSFSMATSSFTASPSPGVSESGTCTRQ